MADPRTIAVLADCHIHPGKIDWPPAALAALSGVGLIVTLGDMGERAGLEALAAIAPVTGVRGEDDEDDPRTSPTSRRLEFGGVSFGCVFNPAKHGLTPGDTAAESALFGEPIDVLLRASTHIATTNKAAGRLEVDPGSVTCRTRPSPAVRSPC